MTGDELDLDLLGRLCEVAGPPGREERVRAIVQPLLEEACERVAPDPLGGIAGVRGSGPRVMLAAHMDEIGLMVTHVDDAGFLHFIPLGGWDVKTLITQRVTVHGREDIPGVVGTAPIHLLSAEQRKKLPEIEKLSIDVGLPPERVRELVRPGDVVTRARELAPLGDLVTGKSLDDRVGLFVMLEAVRTAGPSSCELWAAATVQEEVGLRGSRVAAERVGPDIALAIDTCPANDGAGGDRDGPGTRLGEGAAIRIMDASAIGAPALVDHLTQLAEARGIPHQFHVANRGGTDTRELQLSGRGALAGCVSIPSRYIHSSVEACHPDDIAAAIDLVAAAIETAHELVAEA